MKRQLKKSVVYSLYGISFTLLLTGVILLGIVTKQVTQQTYNYVSKSIFDYEEQVQVVNPSDSIKRPYTDESVKVVKDYYDYKGESAKQENSLIYYENTYIQSSGISYSNGNSFDVVSVLEGTVSEVKEDTTLGNSITVEHDNGIVSVYQSVTNIAVKEGDKINAGFVIATSGTSNISTDLENHLYFELIIDGVCVNPENYYDKLISEI